MAKTQKAADEGAEPIKVRVLCDCSYGAVNTVVTLEPLELANAKAAGLVDDDAGAVAYAEALAAPAPEPEQPAA